MKNTQIKLYVSIIIAIVSLVFLLTSQYISNNRRFDDFHYKFEKKLHNKEKIVDRHLSEFSTKTIDNFDIESFSQDKDVVFVCYKGDSLVFWTNGNIGLDNLNSTLKGAEKLIKLNATYYELRKRKIDDFNLYALISIYSDYQYNNKYIKNKFATYLNVDNFNIDNLKFLSYNKKGSNKIVDIEGETICYIQYPEKYGNIVCTYLNISMLIIFIVALFYIFDFLLILEKKLKWQLVTTAFFIAFIIFLRFISLKYNIPSFLVNFEPFVKRDVHLPLSIGDIFFCIFSAYEIISTLAYRLKVNFKVKVFTRYRYITAFVLIFTGFVFTQYLSLLIKVIINDFSVYLNIAQLVGLKISSFFIFVSLILIEITIVLFINRTVFFFKKFMSFKSMINIVLFVFILFSSVKYLLLNKMDIHAIVFVTLLFLLMSLNYKFKSHEIRRAIFTLSLFFGAFFLVMTTKRFEIAKEISLREKIASKIIAERDPNFEVELIKLDNRLSSSGEFLGMISEGKELGLRYFLSHVLDKIKGFNYIITSDLSRSVFKNTLNSLVNNNLDYYKLEKEKIKPNDLKLLIDKYGKQIGKSSFYSINKFDGKIIYIGKFFSGNNELCIKFESGKEDVVRGYDELLHRSSAISDSSSYYYSYAKFNNDSLISSYGRYNYRKNLSKLADNSPDIKIIHRESFSHMIIPVGKNNTFVISLPDDIFSLYYMGVLYAFLISILFSSQGIFFDTPFDKYKPKGKTIQSRISHAMLIVISVLFIVLTSQTIYFNITGSKIKRRNETIQSLKYLTQKFEEKYDNFNASLPEVHNKLKEMSELTNYDINVYFSDGRLLATSNRNIYRMGLGSGFMNPYAYKHIVKDGETYCVVDEDVGELSCLSAYMPIEFSDGREFIINIPNFIQNKELNNEIMMIIVISVNIAILLIMVAYILSELISKKLSKPLKLIYNKMQIVKLGGKNEKINYTVDDEVGSLVKEYNQMVDKLSESAKQLAKSEKELAWRSMASQIAHEIKNPLTPMKLNIQFMQRALKSDDYDKFKLRFKKISAMLIEQIDNLANTATTFSNFAKMEKPKIEKMNLGELLKNKIILFKGDFDNIETNIENDIVIASDRNLLSRVIINIIKNAKQSMDDKDSCSLKISLKKILNEEGFPCAEIRIKDFGCGIPTELRDKIFEPNFTTKCTGMGMGLAISKRLINNLNGEIYFETELGVGSEFIVTLNS